jgi:hypothetical protein
MVECTTDAKTHHQSQWFELVEVVDIEKVRTKRVVMRVRPLTRARVRVKVRGSEAHDDLSSSSHVASRKVVLFWSVRQVIEKKRTIAWEDVGHVH